MNTLYDTILGLTTDTPTVQDKPSLVDRFAYELGWDPSYYLRPSKELDFTSIHLVVEHGLQNSAIISFLKIPYYDLSINQKKELLNISYNNMVDWHINIERNKIIYIYNRYNPLENIVTEFIFSRDQYEKLRSEEFEKIIGKRPSPNIPTLDDSLISTISNWKRRLSSELNNKVSNEALSSLFNAIIFIRAIEDYEKKFNPALSVDRVLLEAWEEEKKINNNDIVQRILAKSLTILEKSNIPNFLINFDYSIFDNINTQTLSYLFNDFYAIRHNGIYHYDFSVMSNHALSRIYERYISILKVETNAQLSFFPEVPVEEINKLYGTVYTPEYIARFFAKYIKENLAPSEFRNIKTAEPAVGSGIFLRSLLELQCDPRKGFMSNEEIKTCFTNVTGIDIDSNACKASELSLALLQLILTGEFPEKLNIFNSETIEYILESKIANTQNVVLSNPPFISSSSQSEKYREKIKSYMNELASGRIDSYLAFLKAGFEMLKPDGLGLFVLPHSFLISRSASNFRKFLLENTRIKVIADLSSIPVFGDTGIYVILLIFQKNNTINLNFNNSAVTILKCRNLVGRALQDIIRGNYGENDFYSIFKIEQSDLKGKEWNILPIKENRILQKLEKFPPIDNFLTVKQGFVSGFDSIFILDKSIIPKGEDDLYVPFLPDKEMSRYIVPSKTERYFFYPFNKNGDKIDEDELKESYPKTWQYLLKNQKELIAKKAFQKSNWWFPHRPRDPKELLSSKIVTPHLTIMPKFGLDIDGKYAVSRSPFFIPKSDVVKGDDFLLYFVAILNSAACYWYISKHSHVYSRGYTMLEVKTLKNTPVPDPSLVPNNKMRKIINLVTDRMNTKGYEAIKMDREIDNMVADLYNLDQEEKEILGIM